MVLDSICHLNTVYFYFRIDVCDKKITDINSKVKVIELRREINVTIYTTVITDIFMITTRLSNLCHLHNRMHAVSTNSRR